MLAGDRPGGATLDRVSSASHLPPGPRADRLAVTLLWARRLFSAAGIVVLVGAALSAFCALAVVLVAAFASP